MEAGVCGASACGGSVAAAANMPVGAGVAADGHACDGALRRSRRLAPACEGHTATSAAPAASHASPPTWDAVCALAAQLIFTATNADVTLCCAESCTGGMVAAALTSVAGSSVAFLGGVVSYDPAVKRDVLGVPASIINDATIGVVSSACAQAMAVGVVRLTGAHVGVATTGIAGPSGAEPGKPVGTVYVGAAWRAGNGHAGAHAARHAFSGDREAVRLHATWAALCALREEVVEFSCHGRGV